MQKGIWALLLIIIIGSSHLHSQQTPQLDYSNAGGTFNPNENSVAITDGNWLGISTIDFQIVSSALIHNPPVEVLFRITQWNPTGDKIALTISRNLAPTEVTQIWRVNPLEKIFEVPYTSLTAGVAWNSDGTKFATLVRDEFQKVMISIYDANTGTLLKQINPHYSPSFVLWSRNDNRIMIDTIGTLAIYNADTGDLVGSVPVNIDNEAFLRISPIDNTIAFLDLEKNDNTVQLLNIDSGISTALNGHQGRVYLARWTKGGLVTFGADNALIIWNLTTHITRKFQFIGKFGGELNYDGTYLINNNSEIGPNIRNALTGEVLYIFNPNFSAPTPTPPVVTTLEIQTTVTVIPITLSPTLTPIATFTSTFTPTPTNTPTATFTIVNQ